MLPLSQVPCLGVPAEGSWGRGQKDIMGVWTKELTPGVSLSAFCHSHSRWQRWECESGGRKWSGGEHCTLQALSDPLKSRYKNARAISMEVWTGSLHSVAALHQQYSRTSQKSLCFWLLTRSTMGRVKKSSNLRLPYPMLLSPSVYPSIRLYSLKRN